MIYENILPTIGKTPLVRLSRYSEARGLKFPLLAKVEAFNPGGSAKDRAALSMIEDAERSGKLKPGGVIVEPTSGNTGVGLALVAAARGYRAVFTMPETMSVERRMLLAAYGADLVLTPGSLGMKGAVAEAERIATETGGIILGQFDNPANPLAHYRTTGPELWADTDGKIGAFVAGIGTGGTISGVGRFLKEQNPAIRIAGVEPADSPLISEGRAGGHKIQGIGANFIPDNFDRSVVDEIFTVTTEEAFAAARFIAKTEGIFVGISSGAALFAAEKYSNIENTVAFLVDTGERYLSSGLVEGATK